MAWWMTLPGILDSALHSGRYDCFTLSNLALCKALKGDHEAAGQLLQAANFRKTSGHGKAVILFNEALVSLVAGKKDEAIAKLQEAVAKSPAAIRRYCQRSVHVESIRNDPAFYQLIQGA
jgi:tetratricopeptide (TPR) repeat protein